MTHPTPNSGSLCKGCTVAQELSVCLAGFARGKNAHKTSLGVLRKNWCTTSWDLQLPFAKENAIWDCQSGTKISIGIRPFQAPCCPVSHRERNYFLIWKKWLKIGWKWRRLINLRARTTCCFPGRPDKSGNLRRPKFPSNNLPAHPHFLHTE